MDTRIDTFGDKPQRLTLGSQSRKPEGLKKSKGLVALSVNTEYTQYDSRDKSRKQTPMLAIGVYECVDKLLGNWQERNILGIYCENKVQAVDKILEIVPCGASVGFSGSQTLEQLAVIKRLDSRGNKVFNPYKNGISRQESLELRKLGAGADYYLASANAVSLKGELVFFSAYGNRTVGVSYAKNVIVVCGINKLMPNLQEAIKRAREYATPLNCKRLNWNTPCLKDGICRKEICLFPDYKRMCCQVLIIEAEVTPDRLKVILVGEILGF